MKATFYLATLVALASGMAAADEVTDWNRIMLDALLIAPAPAAPLAERPAAIVMAAVFDAVNGIERRYTPIHVSLDAPRGASKRAAAVQVHRRGREPVGRPDSPLERGFGAGHELGGGAPKPAHRDDRVGVEAGQHLVPPPAVTTPVAHEAQAG